MPLSRLVYVSKVAEPVRDAFDTAIDAILASARRNNAEKNISGVLFTDGEHFVQVLEGRRGVLSETLGRLYRDPRHTDLTVVQFSRVDARHFAAWRMLYCADQELVVSLMRDLAGDDVDGLIDLDDRALITLLGLLSRMNAERDASIKTVPAA